MLPLNNQKNRFSKEEVTVIRFALGVFLQTDFSGLTSKQEEEKAKTIAKEVIDKLTVEADEFKFKELCVMAGAVDNIISLMDDGEKLGMNETQFKNCKFFLPAVKQKLVELIS